MLRAKGPQLLLRYASRVFGFLQGKGATGLSIFVFPI